MPNVKKSKGTKRKGYAVPGRSVTYYKRRNQPIYRMPYRNLTSPFPDTKRGYLKYCGTASLSMTALSPLGIYLIRANSCYDPVVATGGHQPRGFDEIMNIYKVGCVLSSKITCAFMGQDGSPPFVGSIALVDSDSYAPTTTYSSIEQPHSTWTTISSGLVGASSPEKISYTYNPVVFNGVKDVQDMDEYEFSAITDCVNQTNFAIGASVIPATSAGAYVIYEITYDCLFKSRRVLNAS